MCETLAKHGVTYVVVGGFALELWDVAVPATADVDITPQMSKANLDRLAAAINELEAGIRYGTESVKIPGGFTAGNILDMEVLNLATEAGPLDITLMPAGTNGFEELSERATDLAYLGLAVPTADLTDVARSKEAAGRAKDLRVLPAVYAHIARQDRKENR